MKTVQFTVYSKEMTPLVCNKVSNVTSGGF